jgi:DNA-binding NarL/FixJ family response regulator
MPTIMLADDHPMVLHGLRAVIKNEPGWEIVGEATNGAETVEMLARLRPDVLVLDILLPDISGIDLLQHFDLSSVPTRVVIFSMHANDSYVRAALKAGASGFVLKDAPAGELVYAVGEALAGRRYLSPSITDRAVEMYVNSGIAQTFAAFELLTARERQILQLVASGATSAAIGEHLSISPRTVETHRVNLMRKLGLKSQAELIRYAIMQNIPPEQAQV